LKGIDKEGWCIKQTISLFVVMWCVLERTILLPGYYWLTLLLGINDEGGLRTRSCSEWAGTIALLGGGKDLINYIWNKCS